MPVALVGTALTLLSTLLVASPAAAADALRITSPVAGSAVAGALVVEGAVVGDRGIDVDLALAPQVLGDCGVPVATVRLVDVTGSFAASIPIADLSDGVYCVIAVGDAGRLSSVVGDVTLRTANAPGVGVGDVQLPTEALGGGAPHDGSAGQVPPFAAAASEVSTRAFGDLAGFGVVVLVMTMSLALIVMLVGLWARRRAAA